MTHELLSPSKSPRWRTCPGSVREEKAYPDEPSGPAAVDGTNTHTLLSKCIDTPFLPPSAWIGQEITDHEGSFVVDAARAERVQFALDIIASRGGKVISERKVDPVTLLGIPGLAGTADITIMLDESIEIWDYKDGMTDVDPNTPQTEQYGFGVIADIPTADRAKYKTITLGIIQPKLREKGMNGFASITKTMDEFMAGAQKLIDDAKATEDPNAPLVPGDHCTYCKHKMACKVRTGGAIQALGFADLTVQTNLDDQIRKLIESKAVILEMIEGAEKEALRRAQMGSPIEGLKTVRGRGSRDWAVEEEKVLEFFKKCGVPTDSCYEKKLLSPAKVEKLKWSKRDGTEHKLSDKHLAQMQTEFIKKSDGALVVVPVSDKRPAVELISAASLFGVVESSNPSKE